MQAAQYWLSPESGDIRLAALSDLALRVRRARSLEQVLRDTGEGVRAFGMQFIAIRLVSTRATVVRTDFSEELDAPLRRALGRAVEGLTVEVPTLGFMQPMLAERSGLYQEDAAPVAARMVRVHQPALDRATLEQELRNAGLRQNVLCPLIVAGEIWGLLGIGATALTPAHASVLILFSTHVAAAMEAALETADRERRHRELAAMDSMPMVGSEPDLRRMASTLARVAAESTDSDAVGIYAFGDDRQKLDLIGTFGVNPALIEQLGSDPRFLRGGRAMLGPMSVDIARECPPPIRDRLLAEGLRHAAVNPIELKGNLIGALCRARSSTERYRQDELSIEGLCQRLALHLEGTRSHAEAKRRVRLLSVLFDVTRIGTETLGVATLLARIPPLVAHALNAEDAAILLLKDGELMLSKRAVAMSVPKDFTTHMPLGANTLAGRAIANRRAETAQIEHWPEDSKKLAERLDASHGAAAPLLAHDRVIGALCLVRTTDRAFEQDELRMLETCAAQLGLAIEHARSYEELARTQEELVKRERLAALGELAAVVAHEVRNPLGAIFNSLGSLGRLLNLEGDAALLLGIAREEADRLNSIISELLDFARPRELSLKNEALRPILKGVIEAAAANAAACGVRLAVAPGESDPIALVDERLLRQALLNLVLNAVQATPRGGAVVLRATEEQAVGDRFARIEVSDTGPGIAPEVAPHIFEPFFTTKATGTGLGLAVVKRIVDAHRGEIRIESLDGEGARFVVRLPVS